MKARGSSKGCSMGISTGKQCPWQAVGCSCSRDDVGQATDLGRRTLLTLEGLESQGFSLGEDKTWLLEPL